MKWGILKPMRPSFLAPLAAALLFGVTAWRGRAEPENTVPFPEGYRRWAHVRTSMINPMDPGFASKGALRHFYANELALQGYTSGRFPDGAVIVADVLNPVDSAGSVREGTRNRVDVMLRDGRRYAATGGWGFESFRGGNRDERSSPEALRACYECHAKRRDHDYVFGSMRP
jgi:hypothetical protein